MKWNKRIAVWVMAGALGCASVAAPALTAQAQEQQIVLSQNVLNLAAGGSQNVLVDYSNVAGGFADLGVAVSDAAYVQAVLADAGNGQAVLTVTALQSGSASVAVYLNSNMAVVSYATVASGYAPKGQMYTTMAGDTLTTVYDDRIVNYKTTATGRSGEVLAIRGMKIVRSTGIDCLKVTGEMLYSDSSNNGMSTFYADFYDAAGNLIKRQAVYALSPLNYQTQYELEWYIPEGCTQIVIE